MPKTISILEDDIAAIDASIRPVSIAIHLNQVAAVGSVWVPIPAILGSGVTRLIHVVDHPPRVGHSTITIGDLDYARIICLNVLAVVDYHRVSAE